MKITISNIETFKSNTREKSIASLLRLLPVLFFVLFSYTACDQSFNLIDSLDGVSEIIPPSIILPLNVSPSSIGLYIGTSTQFIATGGEAPYTFSMVSGAGTGSITSAGVYTAPLISNTATIQVIDNIGDSQTASITIEDVLTDIDYAVSSITNTSATNIGGNPLSGEFTIANVGVSDGNQTINWDVFLSNDNTFSSDDLFIESGSTVQMNAAGSIVINFSNSKVWPLTAGDYYFIVKSYAFDDITNTVNNNGSSGAIAIIGAPPDNIDYQINSVPAGGTTILSGSAILENF